MSFYEDLVMQTQMNFQKYYGIYRRGGTPYELAGPSKLSMDEKIDRLVQEIRDADCVIVGGASGLSAAGGSIHISITFAPCIQPVARVRQIIERAILLPPKKHITSRQARHIAKKKAAQNTSFGKSRRLSISANLQKIMLKTGIPTPVKIDAALSRLKLSDM